MKFSAPKDLSPVGLLLAGAKNERQLASEANQRMGGEPAKHWYAAEVLSSMAAEIKAKQGDLESACAFLDEKDRKHVEGDDEGRFALLPLREKILHTASSLGWTPALKEE